MTNASLRRMDAEALEVDDASFDVILCGFVLHLLPRPERAATEFFRALRPGGRCVASAPAGVGPDWEFLARLFRSFAPRGSRPLAVPFRADFDLAAVLASAGFRIERTDDEEVEFFFAGEHEWWDWSWSQSTRALFEVLSPSDLDQLRQEVFAELAARKTTKGLPMRQTARLVIAHKPDSR